MVADIVALCDEGDRLRSEGSLVDALNRYREALNLLRAFSGADTSALPLQARAAKNAAAILIHQNGDLDEIYTLLADERAALTNLIDVPVGHDRLYRDLSTFMDSVGANDEIAAKNAVVSILDDLFGPLGPMTAFQSHLSQIRNFLVTATLIFEREGDIDDARALAETALSKIVALPPDATFGAVGHLINPLLTDMLNLLASLNGRDTNWLGRAKTVCDLLPSVSTSWTLGLVQRGNIAALVMGLAEAKMG